MLSITRKFGAVTALLALLLPGVSALATTLSAAVEPACCNTIYCPLHHRQMHNLSKDKSDCGGMNAPAHTDSSMEACDSSPNTVVGITAYILVAPLVLRGPAIAETAQVLGSQFFAFVVTVPLTPPPRTSLS